MVVLSGAMLTPFWCLWVSVNVYWGPGRPKGLEVYFGRILLFVFFVFVCGMGGSFLESLGTLFGTFGALEGPLLDVFLCLVYRHAVRMMFGI